MFYIEGGRLFILPFGAVFVEAAGRERAIDLGGVETARLGDSPASRGGVEAAKAGEGRGALLHEAQDL